MKDKNKLDPSLERDNYVLQGVQHKYPETLLVLVTNECFEYCPYCFRKRNFDKTDEVCKNYYQLEEYINKHPEISNILISGGDPLTLSLGVLNNILSIIPKHLKIRIGTRALTYKPQVFTTLLLHILEKHNVDIIAHINTAFELSEESKGAVKRLRDKGILIRSQTVFLKGTNDSPQSLIELYRCLVKLGIFPYYLFQCRPTAGNKKYTVPVIRGIGIINEARKQLSGIEKSFRYIASLPKGKFEILSKDLNPSPSLIYGRYHQAKDIRLVNRFVYLKADNLWK
jgi:KamA family protein